jgi:hypothetical protein
MVAIGGCQSAWLWWRGRVTPPTSVGTEDPVAHEAKRHVMTAEELDAMTPAERRRHFEDSVVDPATLTEAQRAAILARADSALVEHENRKQPRAS